MKKILLCLSLTLAFPLSAAETRHDIVVYGGTSGGIIAAIQVAKSERSVVQIGECEILLVPWSLSASHMAFGSIRMEPVFMTLSQSAATAAAIAIQTGIPVQDLPCEVLQ